MVICGDEMVILSRWLGGGHAAALRMQRNLFLSESGGSVAGRGTALDLRSLGEAGCDGSPASPGRRAASETTGDGIGSAVSVLAPGRASGPTGVCETSHRGSAASVRAEDDPEDRPPRRPGRMTEVPESECVAVREDRENMPPMLARLTGSAATCRTGIAADGGHSDRVFCFAPPPPRRLSSGRKSRQGVHAGNRTAGPTLFVQYPGPWEILASWNVARNGGEKVAAAAGRPCRPEWWTLLHQLRNFFRLQHSPTGEPARE